MRVVAIAFAVALAACSKSKCEKYADMEWKCGNLPASEKDMTLQLAKGMCEAAESGEKGLEQFSTEATCATTAKDCVAYKKCTEAAEP